MGKMKKLTAILLKKVSSLVASSRETRIKMNIDLAIANAKEDAAVAQDKVDKLILSLGEEDVDVKTKLQEIVDAKFAVKDALEIVEVLGEVKEDLDSDFEETEEK